MAGNFDAFDVTGGIATYAVCGTQYVATVSGNQSRTPFPAAGSPTLFVFSL